MCVCVLVVVVIVVEEDELLGTVPGIFSKMIASTFVGVIIIQYSLLSGKKIDMSTPFTCRFSQFIDISAVA